MRLRTAFPSVVAVLAALLVGITGLAPSAGAATARTLTVGVSPVYQYGGKPVTFSGSVTKSPKGTVVKIQRKSGTTWVAAGQTTTKTAAGAYSVALNVPTTPAAYVYRALAPKTRTLAGTYSTRTVKVTVLRKTTATLTATPSTIDAGGTTTLTGTVSPYVAGTTIAVQRQSGSSWVTAGTTALASDGSFSLNQKPTTTTTYRVQTPLTGLNAGTVSPSRTVTVAVANAPTITTTSLPEGDQGSPYSATLTKTGGAGTWSLVGNPLKPGLSLNADTGVISGTPTGCGSTNLIVKFTETASGLAASKNLTMTLSCPPTITTTTLPDATQGVAYSAPLAKTGKAGTWTIQNLPTGLSINADTGVISGTTNAAAGTYGVYPKFTETATGRSAQAALALKVLPGQVTPPNGPTITTTSLPEGDQGSPYSATLTKTGGAGTWSLVGNPLKPGLSLNGETGVISGTPTGCGSTNLIVKFTETASGLAASKNLTMTLSCPPTITTTTLPDATQGVAYSAPLAKTGKAGTWTIQNLPTGLSINADTGVISGTTNAAAGTYGVYPKFTETATGRSAQVALALKVLPGQVTPPNGPTITTTSLPDGDQNLPYSATLAKTGGAGTWSIPNGTLPGGLTLNASTGELSGTPTGSGSRNLFVTFTETGSGLAASKSIPITIKAGPTITTTTLPDATRNAPYSATVAKTGGGAGTWSATGLPTGLSINATTGEISGTPTAAVGDYGVYPKFTETGTGRVAATALALHIGGTALEITTDPNLPDGHKNLAYSVTFAKTGGAGTWSGVILPDGFAIDPSTGTLTGTPAAAGTYAVYVKFTETAGGASVTKGFALKVLQPKITTTSIPDGVTGTPYSVQLEKTGLDGTWSYAGFLPQGLDISAAGLISGTPTETGDYPITVTFTETATGVSSKNFFVVHTAAPGSPTITTTALPDGAVGQAYSATLAATPTGGTWAVTDGSLPVGLELNATTGAITGTPVVAEDARFVVTYTKSGTKNTKYLRLLVPQPPPAG